MEMNLTQESFKRSFKNMLKFFKIVAQKFNLLFDKAIDSFALHQNCFDFSKFSFVSKIQFCSHIQFSTDHR